MKMLLTSSWKIILIPLVGVFLIFFGIFSLRHNLPFSPDALTTDPMETADLPFYFGLFSNLGVMLLASASAVIFLGASLLGSKHKQFYFLMISGMLTLGLAMDDLLMFHDRVLPRHLHIPEGAAYLGYFLITIAYLGTFRHNIISYTNYTLMILALAASGLAMIFGYLGFPFYKDGAKFMGIIYLFSYYLNSTRNFIQDERLGKK